MSAYSVTCEWVQIGVEEMCFTLSISPLRRREVNPGKFPPQPYQDFYLKM